MSTLLTGVSEKQLLVGLAVLAFFLLIVVTVGVGYLTAVEWRDRRRRGRDIDAVPSMRGSRKK